MLTGFYAFCVALFISLILHISLPIQPAIMASILFTVNGGICIYYIIRWLTSKMDIFDPMGMFSIMGFIFFFISPLVQIGNDYWPFIPSLSGEQDAITMWAALSTLCLVLVCAVVTVGDKVVSPMMAPRRLNLSRFYVLSFIALGISAAAQAYIFAKFGGISGFIHAFSERQEQGLGRTSEDPFNDMGFVMVVAESFKYVFAMICIVYFKNKFHSRSLIFLGVLMIFLLVIFMVFGGLRGSRSSTVYSLVFAAGMYSFWIKRVPMKAVLVGIFFVYSFLNAYYWYKIAGVEGISAIFDTSARKNFNSNRQDNNLYVISRDLGRMDVQTLAMVQFSKYHYNYELGTTYLGAPFAIVPKVLIPWKPDNMARVKSQIVFGPNKYNPKDPNNQLTTVVLGLFGEAFVNFGYVGVPVAFIMLGLLIGWVRNYVYRLFPEDPRRLILPVLCFLPVNVLITDSSVVVMTLMRALLMPAIIVFLSSRRAIIVRRKPDENPPVRQDDAIASVDSARAGSVTLPLR